MEAREFTPKKSDSAFLVEEKDFRGA